YAIHKNDPVFIAGQSVGTVVYIRNLILIHRAKERVKSG
ncbi:MAG: lipid-A-disaccharide synthase N-terminal domain-containing protein, partial [Nitrospirota bacterium]|nr:lipid-A-disaccharide synthase N-terminal domain-containing protein [Nitrospirota bacterium]